jgi:hypothetical protein
MSQKSARSTLDSLERLRKLKVGATIVVVIIIAALLLVVFHDRIFGPDCAAEYAHARNAADSARVDAMVASPATTDARGIELNRALHCSDTRWARPANGGW